MHELAISQQITKVVLNKAREQGAKKVLRVGLEIGELSFLNPEQVEFWVKRSFEQTIASPAKISIKVIEPQIRCEVCGYVGKLKVENEPMYYTFLPLFSCPKCNNSKIEIERGRECLIKRIKLLV